MTMSSYRVALSPWGFRAAWLGILLLHSTSIAFFALFSWFYYRVPDTYLDICLAFYGLGMRSQHYATLSAVMALLAAVHGLLALLMVLWSLWRQRLSFGPLQDPVFLARIGRSVGGSSPSWIVRWYRKTFGRRGVFGVESAYFEPLLVVREVIETALQAHQAFRMSLYLPRVGLNHLYVSLLVLNCASTPLLHYVVTRHAPRRRMLLLLSDALLDLVSSVGVPVVLLLSYLPDFDLWIFGFDVPFWYNDEWLVNATNEFQLLLVSSWTDLASRVVFAMGLVGSIQGVKNLLHVDDAIASFSSSFLSSSSAPTAASSATAIVVPSTAIIQDRHTFLKSSSTSARMLRWFHGVHGVIHGAFAFTGLAIVVFHVLAAQQPKLPQCLMQVRPWFGSKPACALLLVDCVRQENRMMGGDALAISALWEAADDARVTRILVRHCDRLQMPPALRRFRHLRGLKLYNSTVVAWDRDAALTEAWHPEMMSLLLVRVDVPRGELPMGVMHDDFPRQLYDIEVCVSNLRSLPDALATVWPVGAYLYLERCQFDEMPRVLLQLQPTQLSLAGARRLTTFPFDVLSLPSLDFLNVGETMISTLSPPPSSPQFGNISVGAALRNMYLLDTNVSVLPRWIDALLRTAIPYSVPLMISRTPFCDAVAAMQRGERQTFPATTEPPPLSFVMNWTRGAFELKRFLSCTFPDALFYSLHAEDARNALVPIV
ncbi:hypothetical protein PINS_up000906 [Pythium insidiosum]|nr:hypothetical protein PINS_up000906 [Pythium insidiosum]